MFSTCPDLLYDIEVMWRIEIPFFDVLYSDKTWVFDQSECAQGPIYIMSNNIIPNL